MGWVGTSGRGVRVVGEWVRPRVAKWLPGVGGGGGGGEEADIFPLLRDCFHRSKLLPHRISQTSTIFTEVQQ